MILKTTASTCSTHSSLPGCGLQDIIQEPFALPHQYSLPRTTVKSGSLNAVLSSEKSAKNRGKKWPEVTHGFYSCENKKEKKKDSGNNRTTTLWPHQHPHMAGQLIIEQALHSCVIKYPAQLVQRQVGINQGQLINFFFFPP